MTDQHSPHDESSTDAVDHTDQAGRADDVRDRLSLIGAQIPVDSPSDELVGVEQAVQRRRRRRVLGGVLGAAVLIVGGVVAVNLVSSDDTGSIQSSADGADDANDANDADDATDDATDGADDADPVADDDEVADEPTPEPEPDVDDAVVTPPAPTTETNAADRSVVVEASAAQTGVDVRLLPWADGFIRIQTTWPAPAFPTDIPDDITALFSDEVVALIEAEQPATINEATQLLSEAGLMDEVTQVFNDHPETNEVFFGGSVSEPTITTDVSTDGVEWSPVDMNLPAAGEAGYDVQSNGTHLSLTQVVFEPVAEPTPFGGPSGVTSIGVFFTSDLADWTDVVVPVPDAPADLPDFMQWSVWPDQLVMSDTGWALSLQTQMEPDVEAIFADELAEIDAFNTGYGLESSADGIVLVTYDGSGMPTERTTRTWEELGIEPVTPEELWGGGGGATIVSGGFDGSLNAPYASSGWGQLIGFSGGFLRLGEQPEFSADGSAWAPIEGPTDQFFGGGVLVERNGTVVAFASDDFREPALAYELDVAAGFWRPTDGPELPAGVQGGFFGPPQSSLSGAVTYGADPAMADEPVPFEATASGEIDGYTLTITQTESGQGYAVVDAAGDVVVEESFDYGTDSFDSPEGPYDHWRYGDFGAVTIVDPATGDTILEVGAEVMNPLFEELHRSTPGFDEPGTSPEQRLLATDGERWIDELLQPSFEFPTEGSSTPVQIWTSGVATNGDIVLVAFSDGSIERFTF